jgi:hypothetical protein
VLRHCVVGNQSIHHQRSFWRHANRRLSWPPEAENDPRRLAVTAHFGIAFGFQLRRISPPSRPQLSGSVGERVGLQIDPSGHFAIMRDSWARTKGSSFIRPWDWRSRCM